MAGPLDGILVVTLEQAVAAPLCSCRLADAGARVIKIERPDGDFARHYDRAAKGQSAHFVWLNRGKESIALDIKAPADKALLDRMIARADVFIQNLAPGAAARLGLSYATLSARKPAIVVCDISGYGEDGPYRDKKAYDLLIQSEAGLLSVTGTEADRVKAGCSIADIAAGMYAYSNILAALLERGRTGRGSHIDVSMLESLVEWMSYPLYYAIDGAPPPPRTGASHATIYPYGPFPSGDGKTVMLGLQNEREWSIFCERVLLRPGLAADPRYASNSKRSAARGELRDIIAGVFAELTAAEIVRRLDAAPIANAQVNDMHDVWQHPQLAARARWRDVGSPVGDIPALLPPGMGSDSTPQWGAVPALGEHTESILASLGYPPEEIAALRAAGAA